MTTTQIIEEGPTTPAEALGMTQEIGRAAIGIAGDELASGRLDSARDILQGLAVSNPYDAATWTMLAVLERRRGKLLAARVCAETAYRLAPTDRQVRLVRAEVMLCAPPDRQRAAGELRELLGSDDAVAGRARALLTALGDAC